jgi:hypothetical protein
MGYNYLLTKIDNFSLAPAERSIGIYQGPTKTSEII